jgi:D-amino-acid dehydrogenase
MSQNSIIIGGGIIGLSTAFYLVNAGHAVTIIEKGDLNDNCSFGNAGYVCPSHFVPLAAPGIVWQGLKWMFNNQSPFYVKPSLNSALINWGINFMKSANQKNVDNGAKPLAEIALLSQSEYINWRTILGDNFGYEHKGMLEVFQSENMANHAHETVNKAKELGLDVSLINKTELQNLEPNLKINGIGALHFKCDAHLNPNLLMNQLINYLKNKGVRFINNEEVAKFEKQDRKISKITTNRNSYLVDNVVIATGSWSREIAKLVNINIPLMPGRGYSLTLDNSKYKLIHPIILSEGRVALTPFQNGTLRIGGTMEIVSTDTNPNFNRVNGILKSVKNFIPEMAIERPDDKNIWHGYRPCSADGMPYIGKSKKYENLVVATGHSMMGLSLGPGTGKLVAEILDDKQTSMQVKAFDIERFS